VAGIDDSTAAADDPGREDESAVIWPSQSGFGEGSGLGEAKELRKAETSVYRE